MRFGAGTTRVVVRCEAQDGPTSWPSASRPGSPSGCASTARPVERMLDVAARPLVSVFLPDRLELIKGAPALRRAHLDQFVAALWPARAGTRRAYAQAWPSATRCSAASAPGRRAIGSLESWDLAAGPSRRRVDGRSRRWPCRRSPRPFSALAQELGLDGGATSPYRPRSRATDAEGLAAELAERRASRPRARVHRSRPPPGRRSCSARRARPARLRVPGPAAPGPAGAAAGRARRHRRQRATPPR